MLWLTVIEWLARLVLVLLILLSFWSITIIIERKRFFKELKLPGLEDRNLIKSKQSPTNHLVQDFFQEAKKLKNSEAIEKAFDVFVNDQRKELEKGLSILGTLGSTTPFIGLLGTILGIIVSFGELSQGAGSTNSVMFSLAEALILTAVGLIVAIPAVIAFNFFSKKAKSVLAEMATLKDLYIAYKD